MSTGSNSTQHDGRSKARGSQPAYKDPKQLREAYQEADGTIWATAERFDAHYHTVRKWLIKHGIHEPATRDEYEQAAPLEAMNPEDVGLSPMGDRQ